MGRLRDALRHIGAVIRFNGLPAEDRRITFYSEGRNYWSYLGGLVQQILDTGTETVCYVSSSADDPGLAIDHPRLKTFLIDEGAIRDWFFANIDTTVMVMTMPDLHQYQVKRSRHDVHYVYVQHSLVSLHMVYRPGAFDYFDTLFCATPEHLVEARALEAQRDTKAKRLFEHGYARLDAIIKEAHDPEKSTVAKRSGPTHYLLAPSWGEHGTIETGLGAKIVDLLLDAEHAVTLRPHPQTLKFYPDAVNTIVEHHRDNPRFSFENNVQGQAALHASDVMICDWSGAALDYAFGLEKPVLFVDTPRKVNNPDYGELPMEPLEVRVRSEIGTVIDPSDLGALLDYKVKTLPENIAETYVFNIGNSDPVGAEEIIRLAHELSGENDPDIAS